MPSAARSYIVAATPRSGSTLLCDALGRTGIAGRPEEYFRPDTVKAWHLDWGFPRGYRDYRTRIAQAREHTSTGNGVFGVKLHWYQFSHVVRALRVGTGRRTDFATLITEQLGDTRYVHLTRRDTAAQAVSYYRALCTNVWQHPLGRPAELQDPPVPEADLGQIRWLEDLLLDHDRRWTEFFRDFEIEPLEVTYEDLVAAYEPSIRGVLKYLGVGSPQSIPAHGSPYRRTTGRNGSSPTTETSELHCRSNLPVRRGRTQIASNAPHASPSPSPAREHRTRAPMSCTRARWTRRLCFSTRP